MSASGDKPDVATKRFKDLVNNNFEQDMTLRRHFSYATFGLVAVWLIFVALFLSFSDRELEVLIAVVTGTTVKVIGLYYIVLRYLFPANGKIQNENNA
jgi:hypothetical protein